MYTECPHCQTLFRVRADQLRAAQGTVRCGCCQEPFDALLTLREAAFASSAPAAASPGPAPEAFAHVDDDLAALLDETPQVPPRAADEDEGDNETAPSAGTPAPARPAEPELPARLRKMLAAAEAKPPSPWRGVALAATLLAATLVLAAQVLYFRPGEVIATAPVLSPWVQAFCGRIGCEMSLRRDPEAMVMLSHDVRSHPEVEDALLIKATFANEADFAQPFPEIAVTLSDLTDTVVARRRFAPEDYLPPEMIVSAHAWEQPMVPPRTPVFIDLEVVDPGKQAINYQFDFF